MDLTGMIKSLNVPPGREPPRTLEYDDIRAHAIAREHLHDDVRGINASLDLIRRTRGGRWPTSQVTEPGNYVDLVWHEAEFRDGHSYTYAVYDNRRGYLGSCYFYPMGKRTPLTSALLDHDVDVSWWLTPAAYDAGYYDKLYDALRAWVANKMPFERPYYSNRQVPPRFG